ncbi:phage holin, LLH family [Paenibacillus sp. CMAA1739]|uniref:phage holin, LLH family n=1 Tax=Paenibacillus ottowii TaxID=2315729 RepID=UPI002DBB2BF9|nr:phage holin, LLH family [Paenibacillus sp. CMAA1739]MEC4566788.1 phage holin, LLH family [Paenibacillus sp. CMAA1739]
MIEQYITTIALSVIGLVTIGALTLGTVVYRKLKPVYEARFSIEQRNRIGQLAGDAYAWVERNYAGAGAKKFHEAVKYLTVKLGQVGISIKPEEVEAAVQKAWEEFNPNKIKSV